MTTDIQKPKNLLEHNCDFWVFKTHDGDAVRRNFKKATFRKLLKVDSWTSSPPPFTICKNDLFMDFEVSIAHCWFPLKFSLYIYLKKKN